MAVGELGVERMDLDRLLARRALLDVRAQEPPPSPDPLADVPHLVLTPHVGGLTPEARARAGEAVVDGILAVLPAPA